MATALEMKKYRQSIEKFCLGCGKRLSSYSSIRCNSCKIKGTLNPIYIDGRTSRENYCLDCGKKITSGKYLRCLSCSNKMQMKPEKHCCDCGKKISKGSTRCRKCSKIYFFSLPENREKLFKHLGDLHKKQTGQNNPNWVDGRSFLPYSSEFNSELKEQIRARDSFICQNCDMTEEEHLIVVGTNLTIHHIDYDKQNSIQNNLITLCTSCNSRANYNRKYWQEVYGTKVSQKCQI